MADIEIDGGTASLVLAPGSDGRLHQLGFGPGVIGGYRPPELPPHAYPLAYPTFGEEPLRDPALRVTHADGAQSTRLRFEGVERADAGDGATLHRVRLTDRVAPLVVTLCYVGRPHDDLLEQWVEVSVEGDDPCVVHQVAGSATSFAGSDPRLTHWGGGWGAEWTQTTEVLTAGTKVLASAGGIRSSLYRAPVVALSMDGPLREDEGVVAVASVAWGGDVRFDVELPMPGHGRLIAGHQHRGAERVLVPGEVVRSAPVLWTWSTAGVGPTSRALHRHVRERVVRDGERIRATVVNTWEAVGFDLTPAGLNAQVDAAADIGAELFLLDDGWFGSAHPRDDDTCGLGDWEVDRRKLPDGLAPLVERTLGAGLRFGLWVEPEMVNPRSALYEAHPDWVVAEPGRERREDRNQLALDLCRPDVRDHVVGVIDAILTELPGISYLKWDANRDLTEPGSTALPADRQSHGAVDRVVATQLVMAEVARRHPDVELMACASGGGRSDLATLRWFHELWTSDNTDPVERVRIQWGASHLLPASVLGAHVTRWGQRPLAFGCAVAMSGRFGFDLDLTAVTAEERATCTEATASYRRVRDLVQQGDLHRLVSPVGTTRGALAYVSGGRSVVFAYRLPGDDEAEPAPPIALPWVASAPSATVTDLTPGRAPTERVTALVDGCVPWPVAAPPSATVLEITT